jgi:hypothetical protein
MSIAILGGLDRLKKSYEQKGKDLGYRVKVFSQRVPNMAQRLVGVDGIVIITGTVAHHMVEDARRVSRKYNIPIGRTQSSSVSAFKRCLDGIPVCES